MARVAWIAAAVLAVANSVLGGTTLPRDDDGGTDDLPSVLECFQVTSPVLTAKGLVTGKTLVGPTDMPKKPRTSCQETLVEHSFQNSYGQPFVGKSTPRVIIAIPRGCKCYKSAYFDRFGLVVIVNTL